MKVDTKRTGRIEWMDILRGLLILSVVLGHSTGLFNRYIYQFHMGAFFLVSGYMSSPEKKPVLRTVYHRFMTTYLPLLTSVILVAGVSEILERLNLYNILLGDYAYIGFWGIIKEFLKSGAIYAWWLGAAWFVLVLFGTACINRIIMRFANDRYDFVYFLLSLAVFFYGYHLSGTGGMRYNLDLMMIAQFYLMLGGFIRFLAKGKETKMAIYTNFAGLGITGALMYLATKYKLTMDFSSRSFNFPAVDVVLALNGLLFCYFLALLISRGRYLKQVLQLLGRNTLPIVFFHFAYFKVAFLILYAAGVVDFGYISNFLPTAEIGRAWWPLITFTSIAFSLITWNILMRFRLMRILFGQEKKLYDACWSYLSGKFSEKLNKTGVRECCLVKNKMQTKIDFFQRNKYFIISLVLLICLVLAPMLKLGIILNDEVQAYEARTNGILALVLRNAKIEIGQGRPLRIMAAVNHALSFIFDNLYLSRIFQMLWMLFAVVAFAYFVYKVVGHAKFAAFVGLMYLVCYPITFEHAPPNAFNALTFIPMAELFLSMALYCEYLERNKKCYLYAVIMLMGVALLGYEFIITFIPVFALLYLLKKKNARTIKHAVKAFITAGAIAVAYIMVMLIGQKIIPVTYSGAKMEITSWSNVLRVLCILLCSSIPGYWLVNGKHSYLFSLFTDNSLSIRALLVVVILAFVLLKLLAEVQENNSQKQQHNRWERILILIVGMGYMVVPALPNSLSSLYQENMTTGNFTALPVTAYQYAMSCFSLCCIGWWILEKAKNNAVKYMAVLSICALVFSVQTMNDVFADEHERNYTRIENAEELFATNAAKNLSGKTLYSDDLYKQNHLLVISGNYWSTRANAYGVSNLTIVKGENNLPYADFQLYETGSNEWTLVGGNEIVVFSRERLNGTYSVRVDQETCLLGNFENYRRDANWFQYHFINNGTELISAQSEPFAEYTSGLNNSLKTCDWEYGIFADGWFEKNALLHIQTGNNGSVNLSGCYRGELSGNEYISILCNGEEVVNYSVTGENIDISFIAPANTLIDLEFHSNLAPEINNNDTRDLAFIVNQLRAS